MNYKVKKVGVEDLEGFLNRLEALSESENIGYALINIIPTYGFHGDPQTNQDEWSVSEYTVIYRR